MAGFWPRVCIKARHEAPACDHNNHLLRTLQTETIASRLYNRNNVYVAVQPTLSFEETHA